MAVTGSPNTNMLANIPNKLGVRVYVLPSTSQLPISSTVAAKIRDIAKEEKQKFTGVKEFLKTCLGISNRHQNETCVEVDTQTGVAQVQTEEVTQVNKICQTVDTQNDDTEDLTTIQLPVTNLTLNTELSCSIETQTNKLEEKVCFSQTTGEGSVSLTLINEPSILTSEIFDCGTMFTNLGGLAKPINNDIMFNEFCFRDKDSLTEHSFPKLTANNDIFDTSRTPAIGSQLESDNEGMNVSAQSQGTIVQNDATMQFVSVSGAHNTIFTEPVTDRNTMSPPTITDRRSKPSCEMARSGVLPCKLYSMQVPANMCAKEHSDKKTGIDHAKAVLIRSGLSCYVSGETSIPAEEANKKKWQEYDSHARYHKEFVEHKRIHDGITPYECKDCGHKFRQRRVFLRHKEVHSLEKKRSRDRHKCPVCNKAFSRLDVLKLTHMKTHFDHPPELQLCTGPNDLIVSMEL
uniref:C2H2-type domain-containing protein n=1 Tax=Timema poppense TaxID=170557 RepID=A0A7R9H0P4_TIMPO|nr:unnamed protein product [Timema poppensis]